MQNWLVGSKCCGVPWWAVPNAHPFKNSRMVVAGGGAGLAASTGLGAAMLQKLAFLWKKVLDID